jgi:hypothetical protein
MTSAAVNDFQCKAIASALLRTMPEVFAGAASRVSLSFASIFSLVLQKPASGNCRGQKCPDANNRQPCGLTDSGNCHMLMHVEVRLAVDGQSK